MARVGKSIIKGLEIREIVDKLNRAYADEWLAYYQYFVEAKVVKGIMKDAAIVEPAARIESFTVVVSAVVVNLFVTAPVPIPSIWNCDDPA